jgi:hypothetical protein
MSSAITEAGSDAAAPPVPRTMEQALDPAWLGHALRDLTGGAKVTGVEVVEVIRTVATKIRFRLTWAGGSADLCLKAFLDLPPEMAAGGATTITEADFYSELAPKLGLRVPDCIAIEADRPGQQGVIIMRDLIAAGARFCTALEPFGADQAAASLEQLARLHARGQAFANLPWIHSRLAQFAERTILPAPILQELLDGPRGVGLQPRTRDAERVIAGLGALARRDADCAPTLVHGDCHAGNIFLTADGPGLIDWQVLQRGRWALDVGYHICAVLSVEAAEAEEWALLRHYLATAKGLGLAVPEFEAAREHYRAAVVYGYYMWAITRRVDPPIINTFVDRLGRATERHDSYRLLGL